ncbi:MAG: patatin-like phospholipase family protein [Desulfamplus sp.]|nr:patatin-like phospholipase family protein [Desulfamplus sp.]
MKRALILSGGGSRGSFQVGVWKYLQEKNWSPDMICGSSIGAINAVAIGSGMTVEQMTNIWTRSVSGRQKIYKLQLLDFMANALIRRRWIPLMDTTPLKNMLQSSIDFKKLKRSRTEIIISAVNINTAAPEFFTQNEITIDHLMASSAMPIIFSPHKIDGILYWDGGIMANIPLLPALIKEMEEIIVVLLSPVGHEMRLPEPKRLMDAGEHLMEQSLVSSYQNTLMGQIIGDSKSRINAILPDSSYLRRTNIKNLAKNIEQNNADEKQEHKLPKIITIAPSKMLGIPSLLNFTLKQANALMADGYQNAYNQLKDIV